MARSGKAQIDAEEQRLDNWTAEALVELFGGEDTDPWEFYDAVKEKGAMVTLNLPGDMVCTVPGEFFVDWVWELLANA